MSDNVWEVFVNTVIVCSNDEPIAASDLNVGRSGHLIENMKVCEYCRSRSLLDLGPRSCTYKNSNRIFSETTLPI